MNHYCQNCPNLCEEIIPTYNCEFQMNNTKVLVELLKTYKEAHSTMYYSMDAIIEELSKQVDQEPIAPQVVTIKPEPSVEGILSDYKQLSFNDKRLVFNKLFNLGFMGDSIDNKLILISLIGSFYLKAKEKNPSMTMLEAVKTLVDEESLPTDIKEKEQLIDSLAILTEEFVGNVQKGNTFGIKNAKDLKDKVNEIIKSRVPF